MLMPVRIYVAPVQNPLPGAIESVTEHLSVVFDTSTAVLKSEIDFDAAFDPHRRQYNSTVILSDLLAALPSKDSKLIGITSLDLFIPVLTFVFGEAQLGGNVAVTSTYRLHNAFYGLPEDPDLLLDRLHKEAVHEVGHTFGLTHCVDHRCVMHSSTFVEDIDLKGAKFCSGCRARLSG